MSDRIFKPREMQDLAGVRREAPSDAAYLVRFFTDLADWADNELFQQMDNYGIASQELSVLARSSYDSKLESRVSSEHSALHAIKHRDLADSAYARVGVAVQALRTSDPQKAKAQLEDLIAQLLGAAQAVGSGKTGSSSDKRRR